MESRARGGLTLSVLAALHEARRVIAVALADFGENLAVRDMHGVSIVHAARQLYQHHAFTAGLTAFTILSLERFDTEQLLRIIIVVLAIGLQFTGVSTERDSLTPMRSAVRLGDGFQLPVVSSAREFSTLGKRGAFDYYLADHVTPFTDKVSFIAVRPRSDASPWALRLDERDRVWTDVVLGGTEGPGQAFPTTDAQKGSP